MCIGNSEPEPHPCHWRRGHPYVHREQGTALGMGNPVPGASLRA